MKFLSRYCKGIEYNYGVKYHALSVPSGKIEEFFKDSNIDEADVVGSDFPWKYVMVADKNIQKLLDEKYRDYFYDITWMEEISE